MLAAVVTAEIMTRRRMRVATAYASAAVVATAPEAIVTVAAAETRAVPMAAANQIRRGALPRQSPSLSAGQ